MILTLHVLVSEDPRGRVEVRIPFTRLPGRTGRSLARLLDDLTLNLMEQVPKMGPDEVAELVFRPRLELRRVKVELEPADLEREGARRGAGPRAFSARVSCCLSQWPHEDFFEAEVARLPEARFAVDAPGALTPALARVLSERARREGRSSLERFEVPVQEHLELVEIPVDLPTPLPSQRPRAPSRPRKTGEASKRRMVPTPNLHEVGAAWTHRALDGRLPRAHGRDALLEQLEALVDRPGAAVLLVGPSGAGKTALAVELAYRLALRATSPFERRDLWRVDANRIIAGMRVVGAWEERVSGMVEELSARQDILFVEDLPALVFVGRSAHGDSNVAELLDPHLARGEIRMLGACTEARLEAVREENPGFFARFRVVRVPAMSERESLLVLAHEARRRSSQEGFAVAPEALETILSLTRRFEGHAALPGRAASLLARVLAERHRAKTDEDGRARFGADAVVEHYAARSGLPPFVLRAEAARTPEDVAGFFARRIVGQPEAVAAATDVVLRIEQGLADPGRPFGTYLFVGPTGVGKTETAKALAELLFGHGDRLIRLDMSEFQAPWSSTRLFGGLGEPDGELTRRVAREPFSVVLLDEIEKAHPAVFDALLQVLGEGRLTNAAGHTVSFRTTIVIMTSNVGVRAAERQLGFGDEAPEAAASRYRAAAEGFFRPELFNRIDRVVAFRALTREVVLPLTERLLAAILGRRGLARAETLVDVDPALPEALVDRGFDPKYGARSMRRTLEQELAVPLAEHLVRAPAGGLSLVELFPRGPGVGLVVRQPRLRPPREEAPAPPRSWAAFAEHLRRLRRELERLEQSGELEALRARRRERLEAFNRGLATEAEARELRVLSRTVEMLEPLRAELDALEETLELPQSITELRAWSYEARDDRTRTVETEHPRAARFTLGPFRPALGERADRARLDLLRLRSDVRAHLEPDPHPAVVLVQPLGGAPASRALAQDIAAALGRAWESRGVERYEARGPAGWALGWERDDRDWALALRSPDALRRARAEAGIWVRRVTEGLERGTSAALVLELGRAGAETPPAILAAHQAAERERRAARREDAAPGEARGALEAEPDIVRWFEDDVATDPASGAPLDLRRPETFEAAWLRGQEATLS